MIQSRKFQRGNLRRIFFSKRGGPGHLGPLRNVDVMWQAKNHEEVIFYSPKKGVPISMAFCGSSYLWEFDVAYGIITPCWRSLFCRLQGGCFKVVTCPGLTRTLSSSNIIIIIRLYLVNSLFCLNRDSNGSSWWWWCTFDILELMKKK